MRPFRLVQIQVVQIQEPITSEQSIAQLTEQLNKSERAWNAELQGRYYLELKVQELKSTSPSHLAMQFDTLPQSSLTASSPDSYICL